MCTSKCHGKTNYRGIDTVYIGVKLLNIQDGTPHGYLTKRFPSPCPNDTGERNVREILQDDVALRMNAMFLEVPIMEPNMERGNEVRRRRRSGTKRVLSQNRFALGCHA